MANVKKIVYNNTGNRKTVVYCTIASDGTNEINLVLYNSSTVCAALGINNTKNCALMRVLASSTSPSGKITLNWDATTPILAMSMPYAGAGNLDFDFNEFGGLINTAVGTAGVTGNITLTTSGLVNGDNISIIIEVKTEG